MTGPNLANQPDAPQPPGPSTGGAGAQPGVMAAKRGPRQSRAGALRLAVIASAVVLALLLVFILQNSRSVKVSFLGLSGRLPLGVALLFAGIAGVLLVAIPGTARIWQLRRDARRHHSQQPT